MLHVAIKHARFDAVIAEPPMSDDHPWATEFREFVLYEKRCYPEFLIYYERHDESQVDFFLQKNLPPSKGWTLPFHHQIVQQNMSECVHLCQIVFKQDTSLILVSIVIFWHFCTFGDVCFDICLKHGFFKSCFQQSAEGKMTALTVRSYHVLSTPASVILYFAIKTSTFELRPLLRFLCLIHFTGGMFPVYTTDPIDCIDVIG